MGKKARHGLRAALERHEAQLKKKKILENKDKRVPKKERSDYRKKSSPYTSEDTILLLGEGEFSFSASLAQYHGVPPEALVCTSHDTEEIALEKYPSCGDHVKFLREFGAQVLFGIDATQMHKIKALKRRGFTKIIFNFPHTGCAIKDMERNIAKNQELLKKFFLSCARLLTQIRNEYNIICEVHVTLKGGSHYELWDINKAATNNRQLIKLSSFTFDPSIYPLYNHMRTSGSEKKILKSNEEITKYHPRTHVFTLRNDL